MKKIQNTIGWLFKPSARTNGQYVTLADQSGLAHITNLTVAAVQKYWKPALISLGGAVIIVSFFVLATLYWVSSPAQ